MLHSKNKKLPLLLLFVYWLVFNFVVNHADIEVFKVEGVAPISKMQVGDNESSYAVNLPDDWFINDSVPYSNNTNGGIPNDYGQRERWYKVAVPLRPDDAEVWAVYLSSVTHNAAVYLNGVWIGQGGDFGEPVSRHHNNPLFFEFSKQLLRPGPNELVIRVKAESSRQGLLGLVYLAPAESLRSAYSWKRYWRVDFIQWITMAMYLMGGIVLCFWLARRQDKIYGLFALQLFIWATHNLNLFVFNIPTNAHFWEAMTMSTLGWTVVAMIFFNHRYVGESVPWVEKAAAIFGVLGLGIFFLPDIELILSVGYGIWDSFLIIFGSYAIGHLIKVFWRQPNVDVFLMLLVGVPILVFGFHDIMVVNHLRDRTEGLTIQYSVIPAIMLFSWFLIRRFVQSINQAELMTATLEQRVAAKQSELKIQYEQLQELSRQSLLSEERERIMRDMHDGIGGQLVSVATYLQERLHDSDKTLPSSETRKQSTTDQEVLEKVRDKILLSLTDLRFVIDSLDPMLNDLPTLLGLLRARLQDQLDDAGIELEWAVTELPELADMSPRRSLHIMRILQEIFANSIKHADTQRMCLSTAVLDSAAGQMIEISVQDYGCGLDKTIQDSLAQGLTSPERSSKLGRGLKNMVYRAEQIGALIRFDHNDMGTKVRVLLPL